MGMGMGMHAMATQHVAMGEHVAMGGDQGIGPHTALLCAALRCAASHLKSCKNKRVLAHPSPRLLTIVCVSVRVCRVS